MDEKTRVGLPRKPLRISLSACCAAVALVALGCASKGPVPDADLKELTQLLPGHYDNQAQVQADDHQGVRPPHDALALDIVPIDAPMIGQNAFYLQESAADDPRRITAQRVLVFGVVNKEIVETTWTFADPYRWRNGQRNPDLFMSLLTADVNSAKGCSLRWKKKEGKFVGTNEPKTCHDAPGFVGQAQIDLRGEIGPDELAFAELAFDKSGHLVRGRQDEPFFRFKKQSREPGEGSSTGSSE